MPAKDKIHYAILRALVKYGVTIIKDSLTLRFDGIKVFADMDAEFGSRRLAIEIKTFESASPVSELEKALGQCLIYKVASELEGTPREVFLAIPVGALELFEGKLMTKVRHDNEINLVVVDTHTEEVVQWIEAKNLKLP